MRFLDLFRIKWEIGGLDAPAFAWIAAGTLLIWTVLSLIRLYWLVRRERGIYKSVIARLDELRDKYPPDRRQGLPHSAYDEIARVFEDFPSMAIAWHDFDSQILIRSDVNNKDRCWSAESAAHAFSDAAIVETRLNKSYFTSLPGTVTGAGLLVTFLAILVALLDVRLLNSRVQGLELLIQGLSGKFLSSIAALAGATIFLVIEKPLFQLLSLSRRDLVFAIDQLVPRCSSARLLVELQRDIAEQTTVIRTFNTSLAPMLKSSFSESMGPTLERMVESIENMNTLLRAAEAQKQESITGQLESLLAKLEQSMTDSIGKMSVTFSESLSGSARSQFDNVAESLKGTAVLLESMNAQSLTTQNGLNELISFAKSSTQEQMALGKSQVEDLTAVLQGLMVQIKDTTGTSVTNMASTLTAVMHDLSNKVTQLGEQMTNSVTANTEKATGVATAVIQQADAWTSRSAEQFAELLEKHGDHIDRIQDVRSALDESLMKFNDALKHYSIISANFTQISDKVNTTVSTIARAVTSMAETQDSMQNVAGLIKTQVERFDASNRGQEQTWRTIQNSMDQYKQVFNQVEQSAAALLTQIEQHLNNHVEVSRRGFEDLVRVADEHFANATNRLGGSVSELDEYLQDLTDILGKNSHNNGGKRDK